MSNDLSIAAATASLKMILSPAVPQGRVTVMPLDKARRDDGDQLNLFLYHTSLSAAWRNRPLPGVAGGGSGNPPLPLTLYYLVTAYGTDDDDIIAHRILCRAMSLMHDHPYLTPGDIAAGVADANLDNEPDPPDLAHQIEHVRVTWHPLTLEELSRLWGGMQTALRFSVAYEASVVLIDSRRAASAALPVLRRGRRDDGVHTNGSLDPPVPTLDRIALPAGQIVAREGDALTLTGSRFKSRAADVVSVRFEHPRLDAPRLLPPANATETEVGKTLPPPGPDRWPGGSYSVSVQTVTTDPVTGETETLPTNALPLALGPHLLGLSPNPAAPVAGDTLTLTDTYRPDLEERQRARLLFDGREVTPEPFTPPTGSLQFELANVRKGMHAVRLRVDGIESRLIPDRAARPPAFDPAHELTIG
jgi:hypothetical protein